MIQVDNNLPSNCIATGIICFLLQNWQGFVVNCCSSCKGMTKIVTLQFYIVCCIPLRSFTCVFCAYFDVSFTQYVTFCGNRNNIAVSIVGRGIDPIWSAIKLNLLVSYINVVVSGNMSFWQSISYNRVQSGLIAFIEPDSPVVRIILVIIRTGFYNPILRLVGHINSCSIFIGLFSYCNLSGVFVASFLNTINRCSKPNAIRAVRCCFFATKNHSWSYSITHSVSSSVIDIFIWNRVRRRCSIWEIRCNSHVPRNH